MIYLSHTVEFDITYENFQGAYCRPCGWHSGEKDDALTIALEIVAHTEETVPLWHLYNGRRVIACNVCHFSSGNTGLEHMTLQEVMIMHFADRHPEISHPALPHNTGV